MLKLLVMAFYNALFYHIQRLRSVKVRYKGVMLCMYLEVLYIEHVLFCTPRRRI